MAIPHVYSNVLSSDFSMNPVKVHKRFIIQRSQLFSGSSPITSSGYKILEALYPTGVLKLETDSQQLYETNSFDGSYKNIIWSSIDSQYYRHPYDRYKTLEHSNPRFTYKFLNYSSSIISVPYLDYGECIKPGSVEFTGSGFMLRDDGNGNLYDASLDTGSFPSNNNLVAYWGFEDLFNKTKNFIPSVRSFTADNKVIENCEVKVISHTFEPDASILKNVRVEKGIDINSTGSGLSALFLDRGAYIRTKSRPDFNFGASDDFTISFWLKADGLSQSDETLDYNQIISKRGSVVKSTSGFQNKTNSDGNVIIDNYISSSLVDEVTPVYPFDIILKNSTAIPSNQINKIIFRRSDGINITQVSASSSNSNIWAHYAMTKSGSLFSIYKNGALIQSTTDRTGNCYNNHDIVFGSLNTVGTATIEGSLDEVRIYNKALTLSNIVTLASSSSYSVYQTAIHGNVFYKSGNVVITSKHPALEKILRNDWTLKFKSTHMIYSYECLVRIPAGSFNLSQNPTTLKNPYSDLVIDEMTGSLADGALFPYATAIGLYNDKRELVAIGKLSQPLQMRDDVNLNILVKWDS